MNVTTLSDCIKAPQSAINQTPVGEDVKLKIDDVHRIIAALEAAEKAQQ